jgi:3-methyladenine DNA glycosylase AlkD
MVKLTQETLSVLRNASDEEEAKIMRRTMREQFDFFGVRASVRRDLTLPLFESPTPQDVAELEAWIQDLWAQPFREAQYVACDFLFHHRQMLGNQHIRFLQHLIVTRSWWDTVDPLATRSLGDLALRFSIVRNALEKWIRSPNLWIRRSALIYQLKYKSYTNWPLLQSFCLKLASDEDFFIRKGIGWALREYGRTNPLEIKRFVLSNEFHPLIVRESLKNL